MQHLTARPHHIGSPYDAANAKYLAALFASFGLDARIERFDVRPWYRHALYAPGFYTGYGAKTLPAIREQIEQRDWDGVRPGIASTAAALDAYAKAIDAATTSLGG